MQHSNVEENPEENHGSLISAYDPNDQTERAMEEELYDTMIKQKVQRKKSSDKNTILEKPQTEQIQQKEH